MKKKEFEMPKAQITLFEKQDILTLSTGDKGDIPSIPW